MPARSIYPANDMEKRSIASRIRGCKGISALAASPRGEGRRRAMSAVAVPCRSPDRCAFSREAIPRE
jgi:hypothetical protein